MKFTTVSDNGPNSSLKEIPGELAYVVANYIDSSNDSIILPNFSGTQYTPVECDVWAYGPNGASVNVWLQTPNYQFVDGSTNILVPCGSMKTFMVINVAGLPSTVTVGVK